MQNLSTFMFDKSYFITKRPVPDSDFLNGGNMIADENVEYLWSKDPFLVKQYMKMIDKNYDQELNVEDTYKKIGLNDLNSNFFLAKSDTRVIMGVRLTFNDPYQKWSLPTEKNNFNFPDLFFEHKIEKNRYAELTKYSVLEENRNNLNHYINGFKFFKDIMDKNNIKYLIICGSKARHRIYRKFASKQFKYVDMKKLDISLWPEYSSISFAKDSWAMLLENESIN